AEEDRTVELPVDREAGLADAAFGLQGERRTEAVEIVPARQIDLGTGVDKIGAIILTHMGVANADAEEMRPLGVVEVVCPLQIEQVDCEIAGSRDRTGDGGAPQTKRRYAGDGF